MSAEHSVEMLAFGKLFSELKLVTEPFHAATN